MHNIELEYRSLISEAKHRELLEFLGKHADDLGEDDKHTHHFIFPDKLLNVTNNHSKKTARIALKLGKIGHGSDFKEIEIPIDPQYFEKAAHLIKSLGHTEVIESHQKRHNYLYKGVELAVKHSAEWGHHVELEILLPDTSGQAEAVQKIKDVAEELGLVLMTDEEQREFTGKIEAAHRAQASSENK